MIQKRNSGSLRFIEHTNERDYVGNALILVS